MIKIVIELSSNGAIKTFKAKGHAESGRQGRNIVCAAVTCLLRTAGSLLYSNESLKVKGKLEKQGEMEMTLFKFPSNKYDWVMGVTDFLLKGLCDLEEEYPGELEIIKK